MTDAQLAALCDGDARSKRKLFGLMSSQRFEACDAWRCPCQAYTPSRIPDSWDPCHCGHSAHIHQATKKETSA